MQVGQLSETEKARFDRDGYLVVPQMVAADHCTRLAEIASAHLDELIAPVEYEVDVHYPGAPDGDTAEGAGTSRRLLQAYARHEAFRSWATDSQVRSVLENLFGNDQAVMLSQCHHNCVMTKTPGFSSVTLWHQDNRYWSFDYESLISVWLALGMEDKRNGCLRVIPGSHRLQLESGRFDAAKFLRSDLAENKALLSRAVPVPLQQGDVLFFHSKLFHAAGRNLTDATKFSVVFSYHEANNQPIAGTRSARFPSIRLHQNS